MVKCFQKNINILLEKKGISFFYSDDSDEKSQMKTIKYINFFLQETRIK